MLPLQLISEVYFFTKSAKSSLYIHQMQIQAGHRQQCSTAVWHICSIYNTTLIKKLGYPKW